MIGENVAHHREIDFVVPVDEDIAEPGAAGGASNSTATSMSLPPRAVPRAVEPNRYTATTSEREPKTSTIR